MMCSSRHSMWSRPLSQVPMYGSPPSCHTPRRVAEVRSDNPYGNRTNNRFSAFGNRRNPTTWAGAPTTGDLNTIAGLSRQGYTFQTWLGQSMGLNHMNGRVEDAILGRFLSPDPHIPDPSSAQSYNRYSYVNNNPVSMVDPSGFKATSTCAQM